MSFSLYALGQGALFEPSGEWETQTMVDLLKINKGDRTVDLGSGDGRIVIEMARRGAESHGLEADRSLVRIAEENIRHAHLEDSAFIHHQNFWKADLSSFNKISLFQVDFIMTRLEQKLERELKSDSLIISHHWQFPNWLPIAQVKDLYLYKKI